MAVLLSIQRLGATLLILLPLLKLLACLPLQETNSINNIRNNKNYEYYLDEFLRLYYNSYVVPTEESTNPKYSAINNVEKAADQRRDDWWEMQGDQPSTVDLAVVPGSTTADADRLNTIGMEDLVEQAKKKQIDASSITTDVNMEYLIKMRKKLNESGEIEERAKDNWIQLLKQNILKQVGWTNYSTMPNVDTPQNLQSPNRTTIMDLLKGNSQENEPKLSGIKFDGLVTEKIRSYYPQCDLPKGTDTDLWNDGNILNLFYNIETAEGTVQTANLRLYRVLNDTNLTDVNCQEDSPAEDDKILRVSAYWYLKPLKKQKAVRRRICDSKVISEKVNWIELNVKPAMASWLRGRNAGIAIVVEDQDGGVLKADNYFSGPSCQSGGVSTPKPIPSFILDALRQPYDPKSAHSGSTSENSAQGLLGQDARAALASHTTLRLPSLDIKTSEATHGPSSSPNAKFTTQQNGSNDENNLGVGNNNKANSSEDNDDCDSMEKQNRDAEGQQLGEVQLRHTRHHHRHQHHQRIEDPGDPRSRMVATQIIWTSQQLMELQRAQQRNQQENNDSGARVR